MRYFEVDSREGVAVVRIDRPPANALDAELLSEAQAVCAELCESPPRAVVLTGSGRFFSAGLDLRLVPELDVQGQRELVMGVNGLVAAWYSFPRPVVCAVNGHAIAGGLVLALCADHRVGSTSGKLGLTEARAGIAFPAGAIAVVRAELSPQDARALMLRAELLDPPAALEHGLLDEIAEPESLLERAVDVATELGELPAAAYERVKQQLRAATIAELEQIMAADDDPLLGSWVSDETGRAAAALLRKS
jgi:enoyl-CoA hydratase/carnithine racemase